MSKTVNNNSDCEHVTSFSLERRFFVFLLLPVAILLTTVGVLGWFFARGLLIEQWSENTRLRLEKASHQITMRLDEKLELIKLIAKSQDVPHNAVFQAFLIQQLTETDGVRFVDIEVADKAENISENEKTYSFPVGVGEVLYTMELCGDFGFCAPMMSPNSSDRSLNIMRMLSSDPESPPKRLVVRIKFDSFLAPLKEMRLEGSTAALVTSGGQMLASTDKSLEDRRKLGETGDPLEIEVLNQIRNRQFGTVFGPGHPPDTVVAFYKLPMINWYLVVFSKGSVILRPMVVFRHYYIIAGVLCLVVTLLLIRATTRPVGKSIAEISAAASKVSEGDYSIQLHDAGCGELAALRTRFNEMTRGLKERDLIQQTFGRYVDKKIAEDLLSRPEALRLGGEKHIVTIMMSDLRNFTAISEKLPPETVIKMLNRYFARMIAVIEKYKGIIVDFYGDSVLVFFNGIEADVASRALDAVNCSQEMQQAMRGFVSENLAKGLPEVTMGIGIHTGEVVVGNIGTESRAKYGIVGANVNLVDRIQATASAGKVVISQETYDVLKRKPAISMEFKACLKGVEDQRDLYEIEPPDDGA